MSKEKWAAIVWAAIHIASMFNQEVHLVATVYAIISALRVLGK